MVRSQIRVRHDQSPTPESNSTAPVLLPGVVTCGLYARHAAADTVHHLCTPIRPVSKSISALRPGPTDCGAAAGEFQADSATDDDTEQLLPYSQTPAARAG